MKRPSFLVITLSILLLGLSTTPLYAKQLNILVYPFKNTGDKRYSWISAGMTHTVITDLSNIRGIGVVSNEDRKRIMEEIKFITSGLTKEETMIKLGQLTGANIIFTGSYLVVGENIRVTAHLLNVETGKIESAIKIDGAIDKIFDLQDKVVLSLLKDTEKVELPDIKPPVIKQEDKTRIIEKKRPDLKAYELYARGLELQDTNPKAALDYYKKALEIDKYYVDALISAGYLSGRTLNRFNEAMVYLNRAEMTLKEKRETNTDGYAGLMMNMGIVYYSKGQLDKALEYYMQSKTILDRLGLQDTDDYARLMMNMGIVYYRKGQLDKALEYYMQSKTILDRLGLQDTADYARLMMNMGNVYYSKGQLDKALEYYMQSKTIRDRLGLQDTDGYANLMMNMGIVYYHKGQLDKALEYYMQSKTIRDRLGLQDTDGYARLLFNMGVLYHKNGNISMAGKYYRDAYDTFERAGYTGPLKYEALENARILGR